LYAQTDTTSLNPGKAYLDALKQEIESTPDDGIESNNEKIREYGFWADRLPQREEDKNPKLIYAQALAKTTLSTCNPKEGEFNGNWENTGPKPTSQAQGLVSDMWVDPTNADRIFICVQDGGLWRTTNGTNANPNWTCISDAFLSTGSISGRKIAVNPFDKNDMYLSTTIDSRNALTWDYGQGVWHSIDGGNTWVQDLSGLPAVIDAFSSFVNIVFAPFKINGNTQYMIYANQGSKLLRKIVNTTNLLSGTWEDVTPTVWNVSTSIREIEFNTNTFGKCYINSDFGWYWDPVTTISTFYPSGLYELNYNNLGNITSTTTIANAGIQELEYPIVHIGNTNGTVSTIVNTTTLNPLGLEHPLCYSIKYVNNWLYVNTACGKNANAAGGYTNIPEGTHTLIRYNIGNWTTFSYIKKSMYLAYNSSRLTMNLAVNVNKPEVLYYCNTQPIKIYKDVNNALQTQVMQGYNTANCHADQRCAIPYTTIVGNDIVYWGNDGGISKSVGNTFYNLNGVGFYTSQVYDVDVSNAGNKRIIASMHNMGMATTNTPNWEIIGSGDGFNSIYDKRTDYNNQTYLFANQGAWMPYLHTNTTSNPTIGFVAPTGPGEGDRSYQYPHDFDGNLMYIANKNLWKSQPGGYQQWTPISIGGNLNGAVGGTILDNARDIAVSLINPDRMYYGFRGPGESSPQSKIRFFVRRMDINSQTLKWKNITPSLVATGGFTFTDVEIDPANENRFFISFGGVFWNIPGTHRVWMGVYNPSTDVVTYTDMSSGLTELPIGSLAYQKGSDDVIYAGTDAGVYRWDKPQGCWVKFNNGIASTKMPNVLINDLEIDYCAGKLVAGAYGRGVWESDLYYPNANPVATTIIPSNTVVTWNTDRVLDGTVLVKSGAVLNITSNTANIIAGTPYYTYGTTIYMPTNAQIVIEKGARLNVYKAKITNACGSSWDGIYTHGDNTKEQSSTVSDGTASLTTDTHHGVVSISKSTIENARFAVNNFYGWLPNTGGLLFLQGVNFLNNATSVKMISYNFVKTTTVGNTVTSIRLLDRSIIRGNLFEINNKRNDFREHIHMWETNGVGIGENKFVNMQDNTHNKGCAIRSFDASYTFSKNTIDGFYYGVWSDGFLTTYPIFQPINISNSNVFDKNQISISLNNLKRAIVTDNIMQIGMMQEVTPGGGTGFWSIGSRMENISGFTYKNNTHVLTYPQQISTIFQYSSGSELYNTGQGAEAIECNSYTGLLVGNDACYNCANNNGTIGLNYRCNNNSGNKRFDFILEAGARVKNIQSYSATRPSANKLSSTAGVVNWFHIFDTHNGSTSNAPVKYWQQLNQKLNNASNIVTPVDFAVSTAPNCAITASGGAACHLAVLNSILSEQGITEEELSDLKSNFVTKESEYNTLNSMYNQLLNAGNTKQILNNIEDDNYPNQMAVRQEMLSMSPYVSQEVLISLAKNNLVSNAVLFEIIVANPNGSMSEELMEVLNNGITTPFPEYLQAIIRNTWNGNDVLTLLIANSSDKFSEMTTLKNYLLTAYSSTDRLYNTDEINYWLSKARTLRGDFELVEIKLNQGDYTNSLSLLESLPNLYRMNEFEVNEYNDFVDLYNFKKDLLENAVNISRLDTSRIEQLKQIADRTKYSFPRSMARSALCFFYNICYPDRDRVLPTENLNRKIKTVKETPKEITVYPNPAIEYVAFYYNLSDGNEVTNLTVSDVTGKPIYQSSLSNGIGQHIWDVKSISNGNYIYSITTKTGLKYSGKIVVQK
jgi:hypothetical protein